MARGTFLNQPDKPTCERTYIIQVYSDERVHEQWNDWMNTLVNVGLHQIIFKSLND